MTDYYQVIPVLPTENPEQDMDCKDLPLFNEWFTKLVLGMTQTTGSGGAHTHPGARLLMAALCLLVDPEVAIETGTDAGVTTQSIAIAIRRGILFTIDNHSERSSAAATRCNETLGSFANLNYQTVDALEFLKKAKDQTIDFIFIDDDHSEKHVLQEMKEVRRILSPGGVAVFHDVTFYSYIEKHMRKVFKGWDMMVLPALSPTRRLVDGIEKNLGDMGIGLVRRPMKSSFWSK